MQPEASPTLDVGESGLMLDRGEEGVMYMSLAPVSAIAVSKMAKRGGAGLQLGIERHSLAPVVSLHPLSRMFFLSLENTVTALLSNKTLRP